MGELREYLRINLPQYQDPIIFISSDFIPGCPMCNNSTSVYYIQLTERNLIPTEVNVEKAEHHIFPIDIYVKYPLQKGKPRRFVIGTKKSQGTLQMILRQVIE